MNFIKSRIAKGTVVNADESGNWNELHSRFEMKRINHEEAYSLDGACTNWAEEFFSRMRRAEIGHHHHIAGDILAADQPQPIDPLLVGQPEGFCCGVVHAPNSLPGER